MIKNKLWATEEEELDSLSVMSNITRYNTRYRIKNESVAAHSFYVIYFTSCLCSHFGLDSKATQLAMEAALVHDIPEIYINDVTYDCKKLIPGLDEILAPYEEEIVGALSEEARLILFNPILPEQIFIRTLVKYADVVSVKQYALSEIKLGNQSFKDILKGANRRLDELAEKLLKDYKEYKGVEFNADKQ